MTLVPGSESESRRFGSGATGDATRRRPCPRFPLPHCSFDRRLQLGRTQERCVDGPLGPGGTAFHQVRIGAQGEAGVGVAEVLADGFDGLALVEGGAGEVPQGMAPILAEVFFVAIAVGIVRSAGWFGLPTRCLGSVRGGTTFTGWWYSRRPSSADEV